MQIPSSPWLEVSARIPFAGKNPLDRLSEKRDDEAFIATLAAAPRAKTLVFAGDIPVLRQRAGAPCPWFDLAQARSLGFPRERVLLGQLENGPLFAQLLDERTVRFVGAADAGGMIDQRTRIIPDHPECTLTDLRTLAIEGAVSPQDIALLGQVKSLLYWHARHRFCSACGQSSRMSAAGWRRDCPACKAMHFPRTDPVVIMLAVAGDHCLMGRQSRFGKGMYSALAGFLEPGETIEEAVRREIREEAGIVTGKVSYLASQSWPFPASLMIGCLAEALNHEITIDRTELEDARWFSRDEVKLMLAASHPEGFVAPQSVAIAHHLLRAWISQ